MQHEDPHHRVHNEEAPQEDGGEMIAKIEDNWLLVRLKRAPWQKMLLASSTLMLFGLFFRIKWMSNVFSQLSGTIVLVPLLHQFEKHGEKVGLLLCRLAANDVVVLAWLLVQAALPYCLPATSWLLQSIPDDTTVGKVFKLPLCFLIGFTLSFMIFVSVGCILGLTIYRTFLLVGSIINTNQNSERETIRWLFVIFADFILYKWYKHLAAAQEDGGNHNGFAEAVSDFIENFVHVLPSAAVFAAAAPFLHAFAYILFLVFFTPRAVRLLQRRFLAFGRTFPRFPPNLR